MEIKKELESSVESVIYGKESLQLMNVEEAAKFLSLKVSRIRNLVFYKKIPHLKLGASIRFDKNELQQWIKTKMKKAEQ